MLLFYLIMNKVVEFLPSKKKKKRKVQTVILSQFTYGLIVAGTAEMISVPNFPTY